MAEFSKFLGIIIDSSLTWSNHINVIKQKITKTIGILKYVRNKLSCDALKQLYFALVNPYYNYGNIVWAINGSTALNVQFTNYQKVSYSNNYRFTMECPY